MTWLKLTIGSLATFRAAVLVTKDTFPFGPPRRWVTARAGRASRRGGLRWRFVQSLGELVICPWCSSMWLGAGAVLLIIYCWSWFVWAGAVFVFSGVAGFLGERSQQ